MFAIVVKNQIVWVGKKDEAELYYSEYQRVNPHMDSELIELALVKREQKSSPKTQKGN